MLRGGHLTVVPALWTCDLILQVQRMVLATLSTAECGRTSELDLIFLFCFGAYNNQPFRAEVEEWKTFPWPKTPQWVAVCSSLEYYNVQFMQKTRDTRFPNVGTGGFKLFLWVEAQWHVPQCNPLLGFTSPLPDSRPSPSSVVGDPEKVKVRLPCVALLFVNGKCCWGEMILSVSFAVRGSPLSPLQ